MTALIVLGYAAWIVTTLVLAAFPLGAVAFLTVDTQDYRAWAVAWALTISILVLSTYGLVALS